MKKIAFGVLIFILAVLIKAPVSFLSPYIKAGPLDFQELEGTLWKGKADQLSIDGIKLGKISWTINPLGLLTAKITGDFVIKGEDLNIKGDFGSSLSGDTLSLANTNFDVNARFVNKVQQSASLSGRFNGLINHLEMQQPTKRPPGVDAVVNWERGGLTRPIKLPKGNYQLILKPADTNILGKISSQDAPVDLKGTITIDPQWTYQTDLKIKATPKGKSIQGMLSMVGKPQKDGYIHVKQTGNLFGKKGK